MNKQLRFLAGLALASIAFYALAQVQIVDGGRTTGAVAERAGGQAIASMVRSSPQNEAVSAMRSQISGQVNTLWHEAKAAGRGDAAERLMQVACWSALTTMTPDQQKHEIQNVWQLGKYKPNGDWDHVTKAPSLVNSLLDVPAEKSAKIKSLRDAARRSAMAPYDDLTERVNDRVRQEGGDFSAIYNADLKKLHVELASQYARRNKLSLDTSNPDAVPAMLARQTAEAYEPVFLKIRSLLTKEQQAEWVRIERTCLQNAKIAAQGGNPFNSPSN